MEQKGKGRTDLKQEGRGKNAPGHIPRLLLAAPKSGSGKTVMTCGLLELLKRRGMRAASVKCGPDYIDPMFHRNVLGVPSANLDTFFTDENTTRYLLARHGADADFVLMEGVMGYYDGLGGQSDAASTYEVARVTKTPVALVVDGKGASVSLAALVNGLAGYRRDSNIRGILLNRVSPGFYPRLKEMLERECHIPVLGFLPELKELEVPSRHLGLISPGELEAFDRWLDKVAGQLHENVDMDALLELGREAPPLEEEAPLIPKLAGRVRIGVARDEAFSFYYAENLRLLSEMGAELVEFSPLHDKGLPPGLDGLLLGGGYPENYAGALAGNFTLREEIRTACEGGMPCLAECGGFLYLQKELEGADGEAAAMAGVFPGKGFSAGRLCRFGYVQVNTLKSGVLGEAGQQLKGHEFHYWDCTENGSDCLAEKFGGKNYPCMIHTARMAAGFPHLYYYSSPEAVFSFLQTCLRGQAYRRSQARWDAIAKPIDGLGLLEDYVKKLCRTAGSAGVPDIRKRALLVLCGDHGVVAEGVTQTGKEVTRIVAENFAAGRSTVNRMAGCAGLDVFTIDAGMDTPPYPEKRLTLGAVIDRKIGPGCGNIAREPAMTLNQCRKALEDGAELVKELKAMGYTVVATGEMGIGNTTPTSALAALLLESPVETVTGRGAGLDDAGLARKRRAVQAAVDRCRARGLEKDPVALLAQAGSFEIAMMAGVFLGGVRQGVPVVIDGAISAVAALAAAAIDCRVPDFVLASHVSQEKTAKMALEKLGAEAILHGRMHLGEGTGAAALFPLLDMAVEVYGGMGSFEDYSIEAYKRG